MALMCKLYYYNSMETQAYTIAALLGRYILVILAFLIFVQAILEIRKASGYNNSPNLATLNWKKEKILFELGQENVIGKYNSNDVIIKSRYVKGRHFKLYLDCGEWIVVPYKNRDVAINGYLIEEKAQILDDDVIIIGKERLTFNITPDEYEENDV